MDGLSKQSKDGTVAVRQHDLADGRLQFLRMASLPLALLSLAVWIPAAVWLFSVGEFQQTCMALCVLGYLGLMLWFSRQMGLVAGDALATAEQNKALSAALREGDRRMSRYLENAPACLFTLRRDGHGRLSMPFVSSGIVTLYGLHPEDVVENLAPMLALIPADDVGRIAAGKTCSAATMTPCLVDYRVRHPEKGEIWVEAHSVPRQDGDGGVVWHGVMLDITERKRMAAIIEGERATLRAFFQALPDLAWMKDLDGRYLACNPVFERFFGASEAAITGKTDYDFVPRDLADFFRQKDEEAIAASQPAVNEEWVTFADDGRRALLETIKLPVLDAQGNAIAVLGVAHDITERKRLEEALAAREQEFRSLAESSPDSIIRYDREGRIRYLNGKLVRQLGLANVEAVAGKLPYEVWPDGRFAAIEQTAARVIESGAVQTIEVSAPVGAGEPDIHHLHIVPERDAAGQVVGSIVFGRDITAMKRLACSLTESEARYRDKSNLLDAILGSSADVIMFALDRDYRYIAYNRTHKIVMQAIWGKEIALGMSMLEVIGAHADAKAAKQGFDRALAGESFTLEEAYGDEKLSRQFWQNHWAPICSDDGAVVGLTCFVLNITARKQIEQTLAVRERELRTLVENTPDTIVRYDRDCRRIYVNPAFVAIFDGREEGGLGQKPSSDYGGHGSDFEVTLKSVFASGESAEFEAKYHDRQGLERCRHIRLTPECDAAGTVASVLAVGHDITELNLSRQKIHQMAFYDALTALPNRVLFKDRLRQMLIEAARHGQQAGVMLLDLDRFKVVNDTLGHAAGDELLREAGGRLASCLRAYDTVARLGGDEFAILLPEIRAGDDLGRVASKILAVFKEPFLLEGKEIFISTSIGIAVYPEDGGSEDELVKQADSAMYSAKHSGRNTFRFYSKELTASANDRLALESDLRHGFQRGELELFYQPKICLESGSLLGSEALLRWRHPTRGMVGPDKFIPIAEDSGLIVDIGAWVLREACRTASGWNGPSQPLHKVAINLSARQFVSGKLPQTVGDALAETRCRTDWIELEITESLLLDEDGTALEQLESFRRMGITIAIDDFGTGYSSLSYLARFPIDTLKIDRSFTSRVIDSEHHAELVKAMVSIARSLKQQVVAEGVETEAEATFLREHGCHVAQGYLYGRPVPKVEFGNFPFAKGIEAQRPVVVA